MLDCGVGLCQYVSMVMPSSSSPCSKLCLRCVSRFRLAWFRSVVFGTSWWRGFVSSTGWPDCTCFQACSCVRSSSVSMCPSSVAWDGLTLPELPPSWEFGFRILRYPEPRRDFPRLELWSAGSVFPLGVLLKAACASLQLALCVVHVSFHSRRNPQNWHGLEGGHTTWGCCILWFPACLVPWRWPRISFPASSTAVSSVLGP
jgi:hypothetical protein